MSDPDDPVSETPKRSPAGVARVRSAARKARLVAVPPSEGGGGSGGSGGAGEALELIDPKAPLAIARRIVARDFDYESSVSLRHWRGDFYRYADGGYRQMDEQEVRNHTTLFLEKCRKAMGEGRSGPCHPNSRMVANVVDMMKSVVPLSRDNEPPCWLGNQSPFEMERPVARSMIPVRNGLVHAPSGDLYPETADFFATSVSPIAYQAKPKEPKDWLKFLSLLWPDDPQSIEALRQWFGYCLTGDTSRQKILLVVGPPRSGKGTIARILSDLLGPANVCGPTLGDLGGPFGLAPLIGKTLATVADARLGRRSDRAAIVERLLTVSGEDAVTIDRKHQPAWSGRLRARFMLMTNELPALGDASGAFASRLVVLQLTRSFLGEEDLDLGDRLAVELPGILRWAVAGWQSLHKNGHFVQPESAQDALGALHDLSSGIAAFVRDYCELGPQYTSGIDDLHRSYLLWRKMEGIEGQINKSLFGVQLRSVCPRIKVSQPRQDGGRVRRYEGIRVTLDGDAHLRDFA